MTKSNERRQWNATWQRGVGTMNAFARKAAAMLGRKKFHILDLGCGAGKDSFFFAKKGHTVTAVDYSESAVAWIQDAADKHHMSVRAVCADIGKKLSFADSSFDAVYAHLSLHYFPDAQTKKVFAEIHRVLKKGGFFFVKCKSIDDPLYGKGEKVGKDMYRCGHVRHFFSIDFMNAMLQDFEILQLKQSSSTYRGKKSAFVEAVTRKK